MSLVTNAQLVSQGAGCVLLQGILDFTTVPEVLAASPSRFRGCEKIIIDLAGVTSSNSAGMALLLEWRARIQLNIH